MPNRATPATNDEPPPGPLLLNGGGYRSLLAAVQAVGRAAAGEHAEPALLFIHDGRDATARRRLAVHRQADTLGLREVRELQLPHLFATGVEREAGEIPAGGLIGPQLLLVAATLAIRSGRPRVVWPASPPPQPGADQQIAAAARLYEQVQLTRNFLASEARADVLAIETPFADLDDGQLALLGQRLNADATLAWWCATDRPEPCRVCTGCRRMEAAGLVR